MPTTNKQSWKQLARYWITSINKQVTCQGPLQTIKLLKAIRLHCTRYMAGEPLLQPSIPCLGLNKKGIPKLIGPLQILLDGDVWDKRFLMTLLLLSRVIRGHGKPVYSSITDEGQKIDESLLMEFKDAAKSTLVPFNPEWKSPHLTTKKGPNGPALIGSILDLKNLTTKQVENIYLLGGEELKTYMESLSGWVSFPKYQELFPTTKDRNITRRLSLILDPEAKVRVIAILDYWTQSAMKPLHDHLMMILGTFEADCTNDQGSRLGRLMPNDKFYSIDLSNATDRFPISVQEQVLGYLIGPDKAKAWAELMVGEEFMNPEGDLLKYSVGQPMGAYSSWPTFTLCHHLTVHIAAKRVNKDSFTNYMLLGDDIVIADCEVAKSYLAILSELGVETSEQKTHVSYDTYEFAKRWTTRDGEITGAPLRGVLDNTTSAYAFVTLAETLSNWWNSYAVITRASLFPIIRKLNPTWPRNKSLFLAERAYELYIIPTKRDSMEMRTLKAFECYNVLLFSYLGCTISEERIWLVLHQFIPMIRIGMIEKAIKEAFKSVVTFRNKVIASLAANLEGLSEDQLIQLGESHPGVKVGIAFAIGQQAQIDQLNTWIEEAVEEKVLDFPPTIGFHPEKAFSPNRDLAMSDIRSKIPKGIKTITKQYVKKCTSSIERWEDEALNI
jgi:hypothetical protein